MMGGRPLASAHAVGRGTGQPLDRLVRDLWAPAAGPVFPANPVLRRLVEEKAFDHDGRRWRAAHRLDADICTFLGRLIVAQGISSILEIGTLFGYATLHLAEAAEATGGHVDTLDLRPEHMLWDRHRSAAPREIRNIHEVAERLAEEAGLARRITFLVGDSNERLPELVREGRRYGLVLVDGAHDFPSVLLDVIAADWLLEPGGYLVLDDVGRRIAGRQGTEGGPNRVLESLLASGRFEILPLSANVALCRKEAA
ncbi:MAG: class I SAM-dependent methyltransferase [Rhodovibrionaceae bacterium]|nr:class I SAM-dependent methyltransferase [Rhodovibrionaceae bacterium]